MAQGTFKRSGRPGSAGRRKDEVISRAEESIEGAESLRQTRKNEARAQAEQRKQLRAMAPKRTKVGIGEMTCEEGEKLLKDKLVFAFDSCTKVLRCNPNPPPTKRHSGKHLLLTLALHRRHFVTMT